MMQLRALWTLISIFSVCYGLAGQDAAKLLQKAYDFRFVDGDSSLWYAQRAYEASRAAGNDSLAAEASFIQGLQLQANGALAEAIANYRDILALEDLDPGNIHLLRATRRIGMCFTGMAKYDSALVYLLQFDKLVDTYWGRSSYDAKLSLGELYRAMSDRAKSNAYFLEAVERSEQSGDLMSMIMSHYYFLESNIQAIDDPYFKPYVDRYLKLIEPQAIDARQDAFHAPLLLNTMPDRDRIPLMRKAVDRYRETGISRSTLFFNRLLVESYTSVGDLQNAISAAGLGLELAKTAQETVYVMAYHRMLADLYKQRERYDAAFVHQEEYYAMRDSLLTADMRMHMDSLNVRYETARKEARIAEQTMAIEARTHQRNILLITVAALLWFGTFLVLYFWNRNRLTTRLAIQEAEISRQHIAQLQQEKQLLAMHSMIEGQEAERMRIAQDLHDGLGGLLGTVKAHFSVIQKHIYELESIDVYHKVNDLIDTASKEVRRISHNMAPHALRFGGLKAALSDLALQLNTQGLEVHFDWHGEATRLPEKTEVMLYRITQELTGNTLKHARARTLIIQVVCSDQGLSLTVEDDGVGFTKDGPGDGMGLHSIRSRVAYLNGTCDVLSEPGVGTTVTVEVPANAIRGDRLAE